MLLKILKKALCATVAGAHLITSTAAVAQPIAIDPARNTGALIDITSNGVPMVHTSAPNAAGVSHNVFIDFNVDRQGLVINNSLSMGQSQLGGTLLGNPNLVGGGIVADLIINEGTGANRSTLLGFTEVFGGEADLVLANPYGITCDGG